MFRFFFPTPNMKRVREDDIAEDTVRTVIGNVNRRIELKIAR